jgi:hypothetical protein
MASRCRVLAVAGSGAAATLGGVAADLLGVVWDGDELCHHSVRVFVTAGSADPPRDESAAAYADLSARAARVVATVLADGEYLACDPEADAGFRAFREEATVAGGNGALVVERDGTHYWFGYQIEDAIHVSQPA